MTCLFVFFQHHGFFICRTVTRCSVSFEQKFLIAQRKVEYRITLKTCHTKYLYNDYCDIKPVCYISFIHDFNFVCNIIYFFLQLYFNMKTVCQTLCTLKLVVAYAVLFKNSCFSFNCIIYVRLNTCSLNLYQTFSYYICMKGSFALHVCIYINIIKLWIIALNTCIKLFFVSNFIYFYCFCIKSWCG